jgi:aspartate/methionine/tyrosine aminotransferase
MEIDEFKLERYASKHRADVKYVLGASDCESFAVGELLSEEELAELHNLKMVYSESQGNTLLRKEIASQFQNSDFSQILVTVPQEGIFLTLNTLLKKGDKVIVQVPCYQSLCAISSAIGAKVTPWSPVIIKDQWHWDIEFLKDKIDKTTKLILINSPHNPTGHLFTKKEYEEIIDLAKENNCYVLSDEMYRTLEYQQENQLPIGSDIYEKCISLSGVSKTFGLGGLRIGWLSIKEDALLKKILQLKDYTTLSNSPISEYIALVALRKKDQILSRNMNIIQSNLRLLDEFFARHSDKFSWFRPKAGPVAFVKTEFEGNIEKFCSALIREKGVLLMPGTMFDYGHHYFRLGFGRKNLPDALNLFEEYINKNQAR